MADVRLAGGTIVIGDFPDIQAVVGLRQQLVVNCTAWALWSCSTMTS